MSDPTNPPRPTKSLGCLGFFILLIAAGVAWKVFNKEEASKGERKGGEKAPVSVEAEDVVKGPISSKLRLIGSLQTPSHIEWSSRIEGRLKTLTVEVGDRIKSGQSLGSLDERLLVQQKNEIQAEITVSGAGVKVAESERAKWTKEQQRLDQLVKKDAAPAADLEEVVLEIQSANARLELAKAELEQAKSRLSSVDLDLEETRLLAPTMGPSEVYRVAQRHVEPGQFVSKGSPVVTLTRTDLLELKIYLSEKQAFLIQPDQKARIKVDAHPDKWFDGVVRRRAPVFDEGNRQVEVILEVANPQEELLAGMFAQVEVELKRVVEATLIPRHALLSRFGEPVVFLIAEGADKVQRKVVTTGLSEGPWVQIVEPVIVGKVVTLGQHLLEEGTPVKVIKAH